MSAISLYYTRQLTLKDMHPTPVDKFIPEVSRYTFQTKWFSIRT